MTNTDHSTEAYAPALGDYLKAAEEVVCMLSNQLSPKKQRAVREALQAALERLEAGTLPTNVVRLRSRQNDLDGPSRQRLAAAIRQIAAPVLS